MKHPLTLTTCALALLLASCGGGEPSSTDSKVPPAPSSESSMTVPEPSSPEKETSSPVDEESPDSSESTPDSEPSVETTSESSSESTPEESSSSNEDSSSEESSSVEEVYGIKLATSGSGFSVRFLDNALDLNDVEPETEISFTLTPLAEYYVLSGVRASIEIGRAHV